MPPTGNLKGYKDTTKKAYDRKADAVEELYQRHFSQVRPFAQEFLKQLPGKTVIDLGAGPGTHAHYFYEKGLDVMCVDYSKEMLKRCAAKGVKAMLVDIEDFWMPDKTVDGIWMYSSLLHIQDEKIPYVVRNLARMLKPKGALGLAVREGGKDAYETDALGVKRWFNFFTDEEIRVHFRPYFEIVDYVRTEYGKGDVFLNYLMRRKDR
jgi:ubiquinone/menaquinone biosynthesis C-methylase UbiE